MCEVFPALIQITWKTIKNLQWEMNQITLSYKWVLITSTRSYRAKKQKNKQTNKKKG